MPQQYLLLTPGPLTTSESVKQAMLKDWCTWDQDYNLRVVEDIRSRLVAMATTMPGYTSVLMQGSGTASVESVLGTVVNKNDKLLIINNGAYGARIKQIAEVLGIAYTALDFIETQLPDLNLLEKTLQQDRSISHIAMVHCETTTGMLNPLEAVSRLAQQYGKTFILDAMSSFGGIPMDIGELNIGYLVSSANKCIQGVPGFGFVIAKQELLERTKGQARSLSLDLYDQWQCMQVNQGKWRFTSPTHVVRAFAQALNELEAEGGVSARSKRYQENQSLLVQGMQELGFEPLLDVSLHSPIITSFYSPSQPDYKFERFYQLLKQQGFVIYPGKVSEADCFRIGNIGEVYPADIAALLRAVAKARYWI
ncbi:2-aminoethylphosphonate--pyruvate transaminase [Microbulbifer epialgicus]|uniref:2-aminoethylphosphonate--pyruvate transaminase n=1 Tax=Microbulbifer epialgicus TaxID=393907 RepID=A0ABV4P459_9GAMM